MKFKTVFGILPVFIGKSKDGWGHAKAMYVTVPEGNASPVMMAHELFHVKQWYVWHLITAVLFGLIVYNDAFFAAYHTFAGVALMGLVAVVSTLGWNSTYVSSRREFAAYGESMRVILDTVPNQFEMQLTHYSKVMDSKAYDEHKTYQEIRDIIKQRSVDGRLF